MVQVNSLLKRIISAVAQAYDRDSLDQITMECLGERLENRAGNKGFADQLFDLLISLDREGRALELLHCLHTARPQDELLRGLCAEAEQRRRELGTDRPLFGGTITNTVDGGYNSHSYQGTDPPLPIRTLADPLHEDGQPILVCRRDQVAKLNDYLQSACGERARQAKHLVVVTGNREAGKLDLLRTWLKDVQRQANPPNVVIAPFLPPTISDQAQADFYQTHPAWQLDWSLYGGHIARHFPPLFTLGSYPWIVLAAQFAGKSEAVRDLLSSPEAPSGLSSLQSEQPIDSDALHSTLTLLIRAAASERPLVVILEHVNEQQAQHAAAWLSLLKLWLQDTANHPVLFVVVVDVPFPLNDERLQVSKDTWLQWLRDQIAPASPRAHQLHVSHLTRSHIEDLLVPPDSEWAYDLFYLSGGSPGILRDLLAHWRSERKARQDHDGRWHLFFDPMKEAPGSLTMRFIDGPLKACATRAQAMKYNVTWEDLRTWLRLAAWEGDVFTDEALAYAVGRHGEDLLEPFQIILDDALCLDDEGNGILEELDESVELATLDPDQPLRYMARYRIIPPILGRILRNNQDEVDRIKGGRRYAEALSAAYAPWVERIATPLISIYEEVGDLEAAQAIRAAYFTPAFNSALWSAIRLLAVSDQDKQSLIHQLVELHKRIDRYTHPRQSLQLLELANELVRETHDYSAAVYILLQLGVAYYRLGEQRSALANLKCLLRLQCPVQVKGCKKIASGTIDRTHPEQGEDLSKLLAKRQVSDSQEVATTLTNIGTVYSAMGDKQQALQYYGQALPLRRQVEDKHGEAATLNNIGTVYSDLGDKQQALQYYEQALPLVRQVGDKHGVAATLNNIGMVYSDLGDKQQALQYYEQALPLLRQVGDKHGVAATLSNIGAIYSDLGDKQQALQYYEQALPLRRQVGDKHGVAATLNNIGLVYSDLGDQQQALQYYEQALPLRRQVEDKSGEATTLSNIGLVYSALGDKQQALQYYGQALPLRRQVGDKGGEAATLNNIGMVYSDLGDKQQALLYYEQALPLRRQVEDKSGEATTLSNIGTVYSDLGDKQQALQYYGQALPLLRQVGDKHGVAATLSNIGAVYSDLGDKQQALLYYGQALPLQRQVGDKGGEAATLNNIGLVYSALGDKQQALQYYGQALPLVRQVGDKHGEAATLNNIGAVYSDLDDKQQALLYYEQALPLFHQASDKSGEATTLSNIGAVYSDLGDKQQALQYYEQALPLLRQVGDKGGEAATLNNIGKVHTDPGDKQQTQ